MTSVDVPLLELCRPKQWPTLSMVDLSPAGFPVYGANGPIGFADRYTHEKPVLLIGCRGSCGTLHITPPKAYANGNAMALDDLDQKRVDLRYLYFYFQYRGFADVVSGSSQPQITRQGLSRVVVPVPSGQDSLAEQRRIAGILDKADAIRRKRKESIALTEELLRSAFLEMFGDPVSNPKGWPTETIGNLLVLKSGDFLSAKQMDSNGPHAVYGGNGINGRHSSFMFEQPMLTIGRVGVYCGAVHRTEPRSWVTDNALYVAECRKDLNVSYLEHALRIANLNQYASQAAQPLISGGRIAPVSLLVPSEKAQLAFARFIDAQAATANTIRDAFSASDMLFDGLVARAFSGELAS